MARPLAVHRDTSLHPPLFTYRDVVCELDHLYHFLTLKKKNVFIELVTILLLLYAFSSSGCEACGILVP